ncbi:peptide chain release factor aRF-1 [Candidatus Micrarchaeota archaeon]|nr:peptide chain release factor aRF-1 [Candidatus Micrarchaeota archaeon]
MSKLSKETYEFKKQIDLLKKIKGRGTELISVYITPGYAVSDISSKLKDEYGQASNIKSKTTQKNVQGALDKVLQYLKTLGHKAPPKGVAIFCGNTSQREGKQDLQLFAIIPPTPLGTQFYRCDSAFAIEPLEEMLEQTGSYGLVVMDGKEATVALLKGKRTKIIKKLHSTAHQKVMKGGQSAARFDRLHTEGVEYYYKRIGEAMSTFAEEKNLKGVIIGGPGPAKENFLRMKPFHHQLNVIGVVDTGYTEEVGLRELLEKSQDLISEAEAVEEKVLLDHFMREVSTQGLATYGLKEIREALETGKASKLLITEGLELHDVTLECPDGSTEKKVIEGPIDPATTIFKCSKVEGKAKIVKSINIVDILQEKAEKSGVEIELVSTDTHDGEQFHATFRGLGVFLRYK